MSLPRSSLSQCPKPKASARFKSTIIVEYVSLLHQKTQYIDLMCFSLSVLFRSPTGIQKMERKHSMWPSRKYQLHLKMSKSFSLVSRFETHCHCAKTNYLRTSRCFSLVQNLRSAWCRATYQKTRRDTVDVSILFCPVSKEYSDSIRRHACVRTFLVTHTSELKTADSMGMSPSATLPLVS